MNKIIIGILTVIVIVLAALIFVRFSSNTAINIPSQSQSISSAPTMAVTTVPTTLQSYTLAQVATHNSESDCWLAINSKVYNVTDFIPTHPGGKAILRGCGQDATQMFSQVDDHAENNAASYLPAYLIGDLK